MTQTREEHNAKFRVYLKKYRSNHPEYTKRATERAKESYKRNRLKIAEGLLKNKIIVFNHYVDKKMKCVCCDESNIKFLTIDHINNNGAQHRKESKCGSGPKFYQWLKDNNYPTGYQIMCMNCNWARSRYGICPHKN